MPQRARKSQANSAPPVHEGGGKHTKTPKPMIHPLQNQRMKQNDSSHLSDEFEEGSSQGSANSDEEGETGEAPRVAQWIEDDDEIYGETVALQKPESLQLNDLKTNLAELPLGALRKAQYVLQQIEAVSDSEGASENESDSDQGPGFAISSRIKQESVKWSTKAKNSKRSSKHAPTEVTSKKPVTRRRTVVEVPKLVSRDPRFLPVAGEFKPEEFHKSYGFLAESHKSELQTLHDHLKRTKKLLSSSPHDLRQEQEEEVYRLEQAIKRTESVVNKDRHERIQREALNKVDKEEKEKQKQGKGQWWMKDSDKRELVMRARYEALATEGGRKAVKKAIEKKQKKISQKEKKSRPFPKGGLSEGGGARKRGAEGEASHNNPNKRRRFS